MKIRGDNYPDTEGAPERFTDDRFARALDRLYQADRASLMTELVLAFSRAFDLDLSRIHNDSTTVKAYGAYPGKTASGFELKQGHSKDHRVVPTTRLQITGII